ncbi:MAG: hypothetical protein ACREEC_06830, partial [Thermoplasmata archaeon]
MDAEATADRPPRRRSSWNLKAIVEDVAGRPIGELQDPNRPKHPYLDQKNGDVEAERPPWASPPRRAPPEPVVYDPVGHVYP